MRSIRMLLYSIFPDMNMTYPTLLFWQIYVCIYFEYFVHLYCIFVNFSNNKGQNHRKIYILCYHIYINLYNLNLHLFMYHHIYYSIRHKHNNMEMEKCGFGLSSSTLVINHKHFILGNYAFLFILNYNYTAWSIYRDMLCLDVASVKQYKLFILFTFFDSCLNENKINMKM